MNDATDRSKPDRVARIAAAFLFVLFLAILAAQWALSIPSWRSHLSLIDAMEGEPIAPSRSQPAKDLPSVLELW